MLLARRNRFPMSPFADWPGGMGRLFSDFLGDFDTGSFADRRACPGLNVWEDGDNLYAEAEVPGLRKDDLEIQVTGRQLTVKGQYQPDDDDERVFHRRERVTGSFTRLLTLPSDVDADSVEATVKDGVLSIVLPKAQASRARKIAVKAG